MFHCLKQIVQSVDCVFVWINMLLPFTSIDTSVACVQEWTGVGGCSFYRSRWLFWSSSQLLGIVRAVWLVTDWVHHGVEAQCQTHYIKSWWFVKPRRYGQTSGESWLLFFGDDSIVAQVMMWLWDYDGQVRCHSFEDQFCQCRQQAVRRWFLQPQKMGWFCRCRTMGASLLETNWCMAKSVVKLCSLKWWHNEWYNTFFYSNLLNEHPPEKKSQHWPCKRHSLFLLPRTAGSLSIPCDKLPLGWCVFLQDFRPEVCALQNWASSDHHVRCFCYSVPKNGRLVDMAEWLFCEICVAKVSWKYFQCYLVLNTGSEKTMSVSQWQHISLHRKVTWLVKYLFIHPNGMVSLQPSDRSVWSVFTCPLHISICVPFRI